jgi:hypothetical protein
MSDQNANRLGPPEGDDDRGMSSVGSGRTMSMGGPPPQWGSGRRFWHCCGG